MNHLGEILSLIVAVFWTITAICADKASHRIGTMSVNSLRLTIALVFLAILLWLTIGHPYPVYADGKVWFWLALSALVGYVFGDWCLFNSYLVIGARFGQLFMTLSPLFAALAGWAILGERLSAKAWLAMAVTLSGIAISILVRGDGGHVKLSLPLKGVLLGIGAGLGQGVGLVLGVSFSLMAVRYTDAGIASTLMALSPVLILVPYAILYKQKIKRYRCKK